MSSIHTQDRQAGADLDFSGLDDAVLGAGLPAEAETLIARAGLIRHQVEEAQALLESAHRLAPEHPATLIALYRFHFYGNRLVAARDTALRALAMASAALGIPREWQAVQPDPRFTALEPLPRFYLFSLKGLAYLSLRLGEIDAGRAMVSRLAMLDPGNKVGHEVLAGVIARIGREDADYEDEPAELIGAGS